MSGDQQQQYSGLVLKLLQEYRGVTDDITLTGKVLTIAQLYHMNKTEQHPRLSLAEASVSVMRENCQYLENKVKQGYVIYGVNTGYGGSADVRSDDVQEVQRALIRHLNAGFGETLPGGLVRAVMVVRANSLCLGYSGVRPDIPQLLSHMVNQDIIPVVPKRGSVSASGDLMPTSYIASCMRGREGVKVEYRGQVTTATEAFKDAGLDHVTFQAKEALALINSASFASSLAAYVLFDATIAAFLTQMATALSVEALQGRVESFHPTIHLCLPHPGQQEVARTIRSLLRNSKFAVQQLEVDRKDKAGSLKQDRYALRSSPQWLGPVLETLQESVRRVHVELNSANDNPIIDHRKDEILHGANFQGTSVTVAMDQARQSIQLCGKLLFGQLQEILNHTMNNGLPPNLNGSDISTDFAFKGMDTAMASYMSELDFLTNNMSNHVLSTEMHNQAVNSMALVSARFTQQALDILQMMLCNIMCAQIQAIDLRWLKSEVEFTLDSLFDKNHLSKSLALLTHSFPWYNFAFNTRATTESLLDAVPTNGLDKDLFCSELERSMGRLMKKTRENKHLSEVESRLGKGTKKMYTFLRRTLKLPFYYGTSPLDVSLQKIHDSIKSREIDTVVVDLLEYVSTVSV